MTLASQMDQRVSLQQLALSDDGYGGKTTGWSTVATVFAQVQPIYTNWREDEVAGQPDARSGYRVIVRSNVTVTASMRILWRTHVLTIHSLHDLGDRISILTYEEDQ